MKSFFSGQLENLLEVQQRQRLAEAYNYYTKGLEQLKASLLIEDKITRNQSLGNCLAMFVKSSSIYDARLDPQINLPAHLRHLECTWAIYSSIAEVYCLQTEYRAGLHSYQELHKRILRDLQPLKSKLNAQNHKFVAADLQWLFENDIRIITAKIQALESYQKQQIFISIPIKSPIMLDETGINNLNLPVVNNYFNCILSEPKKVEVQQFVQQSRYIQGNISQLPLLRICTAYDEIANVMNDANLEMKLEQLITEYSKLPADDKYPNSYCLNKIPTKKLTAIYNGYGRRLKDSTALLLIDNTSFLNLILEPSILLTTKGIACSNSESAMLWIDITELSIQSSGIKLKIGKRTLYISLHYVKPHEYIGLQKLFTSIQQLLSENWQQKAKILCHQGSKEQAQLAYEKSWSLNAHNLDSLEGMLLVSPSLSTMKTYMEELKLCNGFYRLKDLKTELTNLGINNFTAFSLPDASHHIGFCNSEENLTGDGICCWGNGDYYEGQWQNGSRHGKGLFISITGYRCNCDWENDCCTGQVTLNWDNGDYYVGEWQQGLRQGQGVMKWHNGNCYDGQWLNDKQSGIGSLTWLNGNRYDGNWIDNIIQGQGTLILVNGDCYKGEWQDGCRDGHGIMVWTKHEHNRKCYEGDWKADLPHGRGTMTWLDGSQYNGEWVKGERSGSGTFIWSNGDKYQGAWLLNMRHGIGTMTTINGSYNGTWIDDQPLARWYCHYK